MYLIFVSSSSSRYPLLESPSICSSSTTTQPMSCSPSSSIKLKMKKTIGYEKIFLKYFFLICYRLIRPLAFSIVAIAIFTDRNPPIGV